LKLENVAIVSKVGNKDSEKAARDVAKKLLSNKSNSIHNFTNYCGRYKTN
jgi:hypothetical protein